MATAAAAAAGCGSTTTRWIGLAANAGDGGTGGEAKSIGGDGGWADGGNAKSGSASTGGNTQNGTNASGPNTTGTATGGSTPFGLSNLVRRSGNAATTVDPCGPSVNSAERPSSDQGSSADAAVLGGPSDATGGTRR